MTFNTGTQATVGGTGADSATANGINRKTWYVGSSAPSFTVDSVTFPENGTLWLDTSTVPPIPKIYDSTAGGWVKYTVTKFPTWYEVGRTSLTGAGNTATIDVPPTCKEFFVLVSKLASGASDIALQFNGDTGTNYASRQSSSGAADTTTTSAARITISQNNDTTPELAIIHISNEQYKEKLVTAHALSQNTAGAANACGRSEVVGKWANTTAQIASISLSNPGVGNYNTNTEIVVLGTSTDTHLTTPFWASLGSSTLAIAGDTLNITSFTAKKYVFFSYHFVAVSGTSIATLRVNNDSGANYAARLSSNGGADSTSTAASQIGILNTVASGDSQDVWGYIINISAQEKLMLIWESDSAAAGAATAPTRVEWAVKWANTASQITRMDATNSGTGHFDVGSMLEVWGSN